MESARTQRWVSRLLIAGAVIIWVLVAAAMIYSPYCIYTWKKMRINDYGTYTNFLWNSAQGDLFRYLIDKSYLRTHLSFSLLLLAPLFWIWDHAFLLTAVQWLFGVAGSLLVWRLTVRLRVEPVLSAALTMLFLAYAYTQSVLHCDFHGVCVYFVLLPWLFWCLSLKKGWTWLPLVLILGLREDAFLIALPMLLYFAVADRWKAGYAYAGLALGYGLLASCVLFPWINGISLGHRRAELVSSEAIASSFNLKGLEDRGIALLWLLLPAIPFLGRGWPALLAFPSLELVKVMVSPHLYNHTLDKQYSAGVFIPLVLAMIDTVVRSGRRHPEKPLGALKISAYLVAVTLVAHFGMGRIPWGHRNHTRMLLLEPSCPGRLGIWAARQVPKEGVLLTDTRLCGFCANRADLAVLGRVGGKAHLIDLIFADRELLHLPAGAPILDGLAKGDFGVLYFDHYYAILQRGADTNRNGEVLWAKANWTNTVRFVTTASHHGRNVCVPGDGYSRYWDGDGSRAPASLSYGGRRKLAAGRYKAVFRLRAQAPARNVRGNWGLLSLHLLDRPEAIASAEIDHLEGGAGEFRYQEVPFELAKAAEIEPRVTAGDAALWMDRVIFTRASGGRRR